MTEVPIRPAATVVLWRPGPLGPEVLMGQRGAAAVFMPSKFVFPGGMVDAEDAEQAGMALRQLAQPCRARLALHCPAGAPGPGALAAAALRELAEETGLALSDGENLQFFFRAITPPGGPRRFDARFFLAPAQAVRGDADDFSAASEELSALQWVALTRARSLDLPFITEIVLAEAEALLRGQSQNGVPFFDNSGPVPTFRRIQGGG